MVNAYNCIFAVMLYVQFLGWWYFSDANDVFCECVEYQSCIKILILLVLKFHDFRPAGLGVIDFTSLLSAFACALNRSKWLNCLNYLNMKSCIDDNIKLYIT